MLPENVVENTSKLPLQAFRSVYDNAIYAALLKVLDVTST